MKLQCIVWPGCWVAKVKGQDHLTQLHFKALIKVYMSIQFEVDIV